MADWRQIQARIRKAKASPDAAAKLAELYEHTRDAMVAFELARWQEKAGEFAEAARWYTAAAERFRRSQWRSKAEAALARLRAPASTAGTASVPLEPGEASASAPLSESQTEQLPSSASSSDASHLQGETQTVSHLESASEDPADSQQVVLGKVGEGSSRTAQEPVLRGSRRRGRRGGRNRRGAGKRPAPGAGVARPAVQAESSSLEPPSEKSAAGPVVLAQSAPPSQDATDAAGSSVSSLAAWRARSRAGEPALASRMAQLESQLRRLLACPQAPLDQAESAPAGPGVLLLSDSDQVTHYYVESCQTLRIAIANLVRSGRGAKDMPRLKERLAEHLGIAESRVGNYLKEHCAVRWLQLDEGASELAHFAIAVLRPAVNE
jgi:hypothetical protein